MRENFVVVMRFGAVSAGKCISTTTLTYTLLALQDDVDAPVHHEVDAHRTPAGSGGRFVSASVGARCYSDRAILASAGILSSDGLQITIPAHLDKFNDRQLVKVEFVEELSCPESISWWMYKATRNLIVKIENLPPEWSVNTTTPHPAARKLHAEGDDSWEFRGIMLPGQGIELRFQHQR
jgi:hypothetical protein